MEENINKLIQIFGSLSDETRLRIVLSLMDSKKGVGDIYKDVGEDRISLSAVSHQLKNLYSIGLVESEKKGKQKFYFLSKDFCWCILKNSLNHYDSSCNCGCSKISK